MKRVLVTGAGGMLGQDAVAAIAGRGHSVFGLARAELDITDAAAVEDAVAELRPDAVVNCAAWTDVDGAEADERGAMRVNDTAAGIVAATAAAHGASVLYVSSDYVFDGTKGSAYVESDLPAAISAYGRSKQAGETSTQIAQPAPLHRPLLVAVRDRRAELRRDDAAGRRRAARGDRGLRPGRRAPPTRPTWRRRWRW